MRHTYTKKAPSAEHYGVSVTPEGLVLVQIGDGGGNQVRVALTAAQASALSQEIHVNVAKALVAKFGE